MPTYRVKENPKRHLTDGTFGLCSSLTPAPGTEFEWDGSREPYGPGVVYVDSEGDIVVDVDGQTRWVRPEDVELVLVTTTTVTAEVVKKLHLTVSPQLAHTIYRSLQFTASDEAEALLRDLREVLEPWLEVRA